MKKMSIRERERITRESCEKKSEKPQRTPLNCLSGDYFNTTIGKYKEEIARLDHCLFNGEAQKVYEERLKAEAVEEYRDAVSKKMKDLQFHTGRAWFDFDAAIDRCLEVL